MDQMIEILSHAFQEYEATAGEPPRYLLLSTVTYRDLLTDHGAISSRPDLDSFRGAKILTADQLPKDQFLFLAETNDLGQDLLAGHRV